MLRSIYLQKSDIEAVIKCHAQFSPPEMDALFVYWFKSFENKWSDTDYLPGI